MRLPRFKIIRWHLVIFKYKHQNIVIKIIPTVREWNRGQYLNEGAEKI